MRQIKSNEEKAALKIWISIYGAPVGLFILGTIFGQGALRTKLEVYSIAFLGALSLAIISRYSAYFLLDGKRALLSVLFIRRQINVSDVSAAKSIYISVFGANVESIDLKMKNGQGLVFTAFRIAKRRSRKSGEYSSPSREGKPMNIKIFRRDTE